MSSSSPPPPPGRRAAKPPKKPTSRGGYTTDRVVPPASWTRCHAYMERKVRFCHGQRVGESNFCGAHQTIAARPRIPCPYDPSHTIYADMVEAHWPKCPKYVEWQQQRQQPFYCQDCNTGGSGDFHDAVATDVDGVVVQTTTQTEKKNLEWAQQVALRVIAAHQEIFTTSNTTGPANVAPRLVTLPDIHDAIPLLDLGEPELAAGLDRAVAASKIKSGGRKHLQQQASFIGHLRRVGALAPLLHPSPSSSSLHKKAKTELAASHGDDLSEETQSANHEAMNTEEKQHRNRTILEVGAGRGITGLLVAGVSAVDDRRFFHHHSTTTSTKLVLVERDGARGGRADTTARRRGTTGAASSSNTNRPVNDNNNDDEVATTTPVSTAGNSSYAFDVSNLPCQRIKCDLAHVQLQIALQVDRTTSKARHADGDDDNTAKNIDSHHNNKTATTTTSSNNEINNNYNNDHEELIVVAKHLCGCGTDYALKSLRPLRDQIATLVMATCCHGACNWRDYVGRDYVRRVMVKKATSSSASSSDVDDDSKVTRLSEFGDDEFKLLQLWSAGTVKVLDPRNKKMEDKSDSSYVSLASPSSLSEQVERDVDEHGAAPVPAGLEETTKVFGVTRIVESLGLACGEQGLGRACQRIIDFGRREFISHELLQVGHADGAAAAAELIYYVPDSTTPQNAMLIATRCRADK